MPPALLFAMKLLVHWSPCHPRLLLSKVFLIHIVHFVIFNLCFFLIAAASCYIEIILKESDNNVKLIVLDRLIALKEQPNQERVLQVRWDDFVK